MNQMVSKVKKTISINEDTHERLIKYANYGDSLDSVISRALDAYEKVNKQR